MNNLDTNNPCSSCRCPKGFSEDEIAKKFPFNECDSCTLRKYDDDEGLIYCSRNIN